MKIWFHSSTGLFRADPLATPILDWTVAVERKTTVPRHVRAMSLEILGVIGLSFRVSQFEGSVPETPQSAELAVAEPCSIG